MAEREGFEPSIRFCRILTFQASAFDHSATAPHRIPIGRCEASGVNRVRNQYAPGRPPIRGASPQGQACRVTYRHSMAAIMVRRFDHPPSADEIEVIARSAMERLPE